MLFFALLLTKRIQIKADKAAAETSLAAARLTVTFTSCILFKKIFSYYYLHIYQFEHLRLISMQWNRSVTSCSPAPTGRSFASTWRPSLRVRQWRRQSSASIRPWRWARGPTGRCTSPSTRSSERTDTGDTPLHPDSHSPAVFFSFVFVACFFPYVYLTEYFSSCCIASCLPDRTSFGTFI